MTPGRADPAPRRAPVERSAAADELGPAVLQGPLDVRVAPAGEPERAAARDPSPTMLGLRRAEQRGACPPTLRQPHRSTAVRSVRPWSTPDRPPIASTTSFSPPATRRPP